jgi:two-component system sensor histidine kinase KdpD
METEQLRSSLLSSVSHDLRTPLAVVAGASSSLLESGDSLSAETRRELLESIVKESDRLARLVENLLQMTRLSSGGVAVAKEWHPVEEVIGSALRRLDRALHERRIDVHLPEATPLGFFDALLVEQVLINLLDNAIKYSPDNSPIEVRVTGGDAGLVLEVADRGRGLAPEDLGQLFEKFYRGRAARADRRGTGLGLAICKAVVEAHGGTISADNRPGGGAVFRFTLPAPSPAPRVFLDDEPGKD